MTHNVPIRNAIPYSVFDAAFYAIISGYDVNLAKYKRPGGRSVSNRQNSSLKHVVFINRIEGMQDVVPPDAISNEHGADSIREAYSRERAPQLYFVTKARIDRTFWVEEKDGSRHQIGSWSLVFEDRCFWLERETEGEVYKMCWIHQAGGKHDVDYNACTQMLSEDDRMMLIRLMRVWEKSVGECYQKLESSLLPTLAGVEVVEMPVELAEKDKCGGGACHVEDPKHHFDAWKERQPRHFNRLPLEILRTRADVAEAAKKHIDDWKEGRLKARAKGPSATAEA